MNYSITDAAVFVNRSLQRKKRKLVPAENMVRVGNDRSAIVDCAEPPTVEMTAWVRAYKDGVEYQGQAVVLVPLSECALDTEWVEVKRREKEAMEARLKEEADLRERRVRKNELRQLAQLQKKYGGLVPSEDTNER